MNQPKFRHVFTRYHFPDVGNAVSLLTLRQKLGSAEVVEEIENQDDEETTTVYYGWWLEGEKIEGSPRRNQNISELIPEVGGSINLTAPSFWGESEYNFKLFRKNHNVFVVVDGGF